MQTTIDISLRNAFKWHRFLYLWETVGFGFLVVLLFFITQLEISYADEGLEGLKGFTYANCCEIQIYNPTLGSVSCANGKQKWGYQIGLSSATGPTYFYARCVGYCPFQAREPTALTGKAICEALCGCGVGP